MPKPKGWTEAELRERDRIAEALMRERHMKKKNAYAVATWRVEHKAKEGK